MFICVGESDDEGGRSGGKVNRGGADGRAGAGGVVDRDAEGVVCVRRPAVEAADDASCVG